MRNRYNTTKKGSKHRNKFNKRSIMRDGENFIEELNQELIRPGEFK